jgi:hypothetical protein
MAHVRANGVANLEDQIRRDNPELTDVEVRQRVQETVIGWRSSGGRQAAINRAVREAAVREMLVALPQVIADAEVHLDRLRTLASLAEDVA